MRLDQFLVKSNICSRSEAKQYIKKGRVNINGKVCKDSALHIDENDDQITLDGKSIFYEEFRYYMLNKPEGCVSATRDGLSETVLDLIRGEVTKDLFPVGRLDKDTEGLLLISNDGKMAHDLLSPRHHVEKVYYVEADRELSDDDINSMENGLDIGDEKLTLPAKVTKQGIKNDRYCYLLTICEGRFHQVKRMFESCNSTVTYLKRMEFGTLKLDEKLGPGEYRRLTEEEVQALKNINCAN